MTPAPRLHGVARGRHSGEGNSMDVLELLLSEPTLTVEEAEAEARWRAGE